MPKISHEKRLARRDRILKAARTCFLRQGLHATTMDRIIKECGLSAGAVYGYFPSKEDLIFSAVTTSLEGLHQFLKPLFQKRPLPPPDVLLHEIAGSIVAFSDLAGVDLKRLALLGWSESQCNARLGEVMRLQYAGFLELLTEAATIWQRTEVVPPSTDPGHIAKVLLACAMGFVAQSALVGNITPDDLGCGLRQLIPKG